MESFDYRVGLACRLQNTGTGHLFLPAKKNGKRTGGKGMFLPVRKEVAAALEPLIAKENMCC